ncbi:UDP-N-acetylmuramyl-tripeptide synthetase [Patescibacteria group bacterium]|nr:MAG: UDP-N-acetylmuramyl-tripeptide synthetase [Patescibacteria group bacterium]
MISLIKKLIPDWLYKRVQSPYHFLLACLGALLYRFPSRSIQVVGVTGTKGKTTTTELVASILEEAGMKVALASTLRFKIGAKSMRNLHKMTMPGRFFMQRFLRQAVERGCRWAVIEMTSEGVAQWRHLFIDLDALIFTNISPEHIESHGSFEKYLQAKLALGRALANSPKKHRAIIVNKDDARGIDFLSLPIPNKYPFSISQATSYETRDDGVSLTFEGVRIISSLRGLFNIYNILAAASLASAFGISPQTIKRGIERVGAVRGRVEFVKIDQRQTTNDQRHKAQNFDVVVDYAHTPDSLEKLYQAFDDRRKICVLGNTGGGRDKWKRPEMGRIADSYCEHIILTNEDPYDEDPLEILNQMKEGIKNKPFEIVLDRREAIKKAITLAKISRLNLDKGERKNIIVLVTGKGTDPYIMGPKGSKTPWDDATVVREELEKVPQ